MSLECREVHDDLERFVLGDVPRDRAARIRAHLADCAACRPAEQQCRAILRRIRRQGEHPPLTRSFRRDLLAAGAAEIKAARRRAWRYRAVGAAASVAAAVMIGLGLRAGLRTWAHAPAPPAAPADQAGRFPRRWLYSGAKAATASTADSIVVRGSSVYMLRERQGRTHVVAIDPASGAERWRSARDSMGYLAADADRVFCLAIDQAGTLKLTALRAGDGTELWSHAGHTPRPSAPPFRPVPLSEDRVCWIAGREVHMLDARTGKAIWVRPMPGEGGLSRPVAEGGRLYVMAGEALRCLDARTGTPLWAQAFTTAQAGRGRPLLAVSIGRAYVARSPRAGQSVLSCVDLDRRDVLWTRRVPLVQWLCATRERVHLRAGQVLALNARNGRTVWARPAEGCSPLTLIDDRLYFVDSSGPGRLACLEQRTGRLEWEVAGLRSCDAFAKVGDTGYVKTRDGVVHAIALCQADPH